MIDERFAADAFARLGPDSPAAEDLVSELREEIAEALRADLEASFARVATRLRELGHELETYETEADRGTRTLTYRDLGLDRAHVDHKLRIHADLVVSAGYADCRHLDGPA